ncbi:MAG: hypothetical protein ACKVQB_10675 [Bacteroidia bacterium]
MEYLNTGLHHLHNFLRWGVILAGLWAIYLAYTGVNKKRNWDAKDNKAGMWFILFCHLQLVIGFALYFYLGQYNLLSGDGMKNAVNRYWGMEHLFGMVIGVALIQYGRIASKKATNDIIKHKKALIWFTVGLLIILINIPWPWRELGIGRGWFPGM